MASVPTSGAVSTAQSTEDNTATNAENSDDGAKSLLNVEAAEDDADEPSPDGDILERDMWNNKAEFLLSCIGMSVGLGNVWRFPYLAYTHGGAAFLMAYIILQFIVGKPMYFMELAIGQYSGGGTTTCWEFNPAAKGIGFSMCLIAYLISYYYNIIIAYALFYFFTSMKSLPWKDDCSQDWLGDNKYCYDGSHNCSMQGQCRSTSDIYFYEEVIHKSPGLSEIGVPITDLTMCLMLAWFLTLVCLVQGIKSSGKAVYFTATFPYLILIILFLRGVTLEGSGEGIEFYIVPKWKKLLKADVWTAALGQVFFSLSLSFGPIIMYGSYNKFTNKLDSDSVIIAFADLFTSFLSGFVVFSFLGSLAFVLDAPFTEVVSGGYGLVFVVYPQALSYLPIPHFWCCIFFLMVILLGVDSEFGLLETVLTGITDLWPNLRKNKLWLTIGFAATGFITGLPLSSPGGDHLVALVDYYSNLSILFVSTLECIAVMWIYGAKPFMKDVTFMLGKKPHSWVYWIICWYMCPVVIFTLLLQSLIKYEPPRIENDALPISAQVVGWLMVLIILSPIPIFFILRVVEGRKAKANLFQFLFKPTDKWKPNDGSSNDQTVEDAEKGGEEPTEPTETGLEQSTDGKLEEVESKTT